MNNLKNNEPSENVKELVRIQSELHFYGMEEKGVENFEISEQDFEKVVMKCHAFSFYFCI